MKRIARLLGLLGATTAVGLLINAGPSEVQAVDEDPGGGCPKQKCININNCGPSLSNSMCVYKMNENGDMDCIGQGLCT